MLDAAKTQSRNEVKICGRLNELEIKTGEKSDPNTPTGIKRWVTGKAEIICDQEINGEVVETRIENKMLAFQYNSKGNENPMYEKIQKYATQFTSVSAADDPSEASLVTINSAQIKENIWVDDSGTEHTGWMIEGNFLNKKREDDIEGTDFIVTAYIFKMDDDISKDTNEPTGRIKLTVGIIGYGGKMNRVEMYAEGNYKAYIEQNWQIKDTVIIRGIINMIKDSEVYYEKQGFGEPVRKVRPIFKKELIITGGSEYGLEENESYDEDSIRKSLGERQVYIEQKREDAQKKAKAQKATKVDFSDF